MPRAVALDSTRATCVLTDAGGVRSMHTASPRLDDRTKARRSRGRARRERRAATT